MKIRLILLLFPVVCFSQERIFKGKVTAETSVNGILVVNLTRQTQVSTDDFGNFLIKAEPGDLLIFSALHLYRKRYLVEEEDFVQKISIKMEAKPVEIEAIEIERINISAESLGIIPKGRKRYTPAERRLKTAEDANLQYFLLIPTLSFSLDPLLNAMSGRTKMLKKELEIERFEVNLRQTEYYISDEMIVSEFEIPEEYTKGFRMFLVDSPEFSKVMKTRNTKEITSKAFSLAEAYKKLIADEN